MSYAVTVEYAVKLLWSRWLTATLLYWLAAGIYFVWRGSLTQDPLWIWVIGSALLWGAVGVAYVFVRLHILNLIEKEMHRKSIM